MQDKLKSGNGKIVSLNHFKEYFNLIAKRLSINILFSIFLISLCFCNIENPQSKNNRKNFSVFSFLVNNPIPPNLNIVTTQVGSMNLTHSSPKTISLDNGKLLVVGNGAELFDTFTLSFSVIPNSTLNRIFPTLTKLQDGKILVLGGNVSTVEIYDPNTMAFSNTGGMIQAFRSAPATLLSNGKVLVTGGFQPPSSTLPSAEIYDPATGLFASTGNMNYARRGHNATLLDDGTVLIVGGYDSQNKIVSTIEIYNPATGLFSIINNSLCEFSSGFSGENSVLLSNKNVFIADNGYPAGLQIFDSSTSNCSSLQVSLRGVGNFSIAPLKDGRILLVGGATVDKYVSELNIYNPNSNTLSYLGNMSIARSYTQNVILNDGRVLITRGSPPRYAKIVEIYTP